MPFERPTITTIKERIEKAIEARLFGNVSLLRNAILRILARVFAGAIHGNYGYLTWLSRQLFVTAAETEFLNRHGRMWGVVRRAGSFAVGTVRFTGTDGNTVPEGSILQNDEGIEFITLYDGVIGGGIAIIDIQSTEADEESNLDYGISLQLISPISGVDDAAELIVSTAGGASPEEDEPYRARILQRIQTIPSGGSAADYVRWATEIDGVEYAWCFPLYSGPGTVSTVIKASGTSPIPSSALLIEVQNHIENLRPVTAYHTTLPIAQCDIIINIAMTPNDDDYKTRVEENINALFSPHRPGAVLPISQVRAAISNAGVTDFRITQLSVFSTIVDPNADIILTGLQYPILDAIIWETY